MKAMKFVKDPFFKVSKEFNFKAFFEIDLNLRV